MSYIVPGQSIQQFIPNYVVKSDYLPTRVVEGSNSQAAQLVLFAFTAASTIRGRKEKRSRIHDPPCRVQPQQIRLLQGVRGSPSRPPTGSTKLQPSRQEMIV